jgi:hypothetical protein
MVSMQLITGKVGKHSSNSSTLVFYLRKPYVIANNIEEGKEYIFEFKGEVENIEIKKEFEVENNNEEVVKHGGVSKLFE